MSTRVKIGKHSYSDLTVVAALNDFEAGVWKASDFNDPGELLSLAICYNRKDCIKLLLDELGVPQAGLTLKQRISIFQLGVDL